MEYVYIAITLTKSITVGSCKKYTKPHIPVEGMCVSHACVALLLQLREDYKRRSHSIASLTVWCN